MTPIFIFSAPRTGSTLLQRILSSHTDIATTPEPWILLPLISMSKQGTHLSSYSSQVSTQAINSFTQEIDNNNYNNKNNNNNNYNELLADFVLSLYQGAIQGDESFFIDKTPRYYYIIDEIINLFPNAKFIFLFRNPVQMYASVLTTWCNNSFFKLYRNKDDLYLAPKLLSNAYVKYKDISLAVNYDDLVSNNKNECNKIVTYLGIQEDLTTSFECETNCFNKGQMGDPTGQIKYTSVSTESINSWREVFNNPFRKWYLKRYIDLLGDAVASAHAYDRANIKQEIDSLPSKGLLHAVKDIAKDIVGAFYQHLVYKFKLNLLFSSKHKNNNGFFD